MCSSHFHWNCLVLTTEIYTNLQWKIENETCETCTQVLYWMLDYVLNWLSFNTIRSYPYASASFHAEKNKYQHPSVK